VTNVRLQPVDRQDGPASLLELLSQEGLIGESKRYQLLVAIEEVSHRPFADGDATLQELAVDLGNAAMVSVT
jgi:hypothetical protein